MSQQRIADLWHIHSRFLRSAHLERDFHDPAGLSGYVATKFVGSCLERLGEGFGEVPASRAWRHRATMAPVELENSLCYWPTLWENATTALPLNSEGLSICRVAGFSHRISPHIGYLFQAVAWPVDSPSRTSHPGWCL